eukprot:sb/3469197/
MAYICAGKRKGKTINFIRVVCHDHEVINFPFSTVTTNSEGLNDIIGPDLNSHISEVYKITSAHLIRLLKKQFLLCEHLSAIRDYLLLGQGDFIQHLMDLICKDLSAMSFDIQSSMLQSKLETINFIRVVCHDHEVINFPFSTVTTNSEGLNDIIGPDLNSHISEVYKITSAHLIRLLKKQFLLCEHLSAIRDYLLLGQGDFIQHLMDLICTDLSAMSFDIQSSMLQSKLEVCIWIT